MLQWDDSAADIEGAVRSALQAGAQELRDESNRLSPTVSGDMDDSAVIAVAGDEAAVGYRSAYAVKQHEDLYYKHKNGEQAKFLETALVNKQTEITEAMAAKLRQKLGD